MLCEVTERAMAHIGSEEVLLGGGVACNQRLKEMVDIMARERGAVSFAPPPSLAVDNGAMIGYLGEKMHLGGVVHHLGDTAIDQKFRTDMVEVTWREVKEITTIRTPGTIRAPMAATLRGDLRRRQSITKAMNPASGGSDPASRPASAQRVR